MTDTLTVGSITQLTHDGRGHRWIWRAEPLFEDEVDCAQFAKPDPRDMRIAELEAALKVIGALTMTPGAMSCVAISQIVNVTLMSAPEGDMRETVEEWDA